MIYDLKKILDIGEENGFAVPAFNVYNLETVMGVMQAAEETGAPVIFQMYSRLFDSQIAQYVAPIIREAMNNMKTPVAFHLDHGAGVPEVLRAFRYGATGVMIDASRKPLDENIAITKGVVEMAAEMGIGVEGELGEVGKAAEGVSKDYTKVEDAAKFVNETGVCALAVAVGTAHGHYKQAPVLALKRIEELHEGQKAHLVLHGGSGTPEDQLRAAIANGIAKINIYSELTAAWNREMFEFLRNRREMTCWFSVSCRRPEEAMREAMRAKMRLFGSAGRA